MAWCLSIVSGTFVQALHLYTRGFSIYKPIEVKSGVDQIENNLCVPSSSIPAVAAGVVVVVVFVGVILCSIELVVVVVVVVVVCSSGIRQ